MFNFSKKIYQNQKGAAALLTVVIISSAVLIMAYSASLLGIGELEMNYNQQKGSRAFSLADGCAEEAMRRLRLDTNYTGGTLSLGGGSCIISVIPSGVSRTINISATEGEYNQSLEIIISLSGNIITINSWQEI